MVRLVVAAAAAADSTEATAVMAVRAEGIHGEAIERLANAPARMGSEGQPVGQLELAMETPPRRLAQ